MNSFGKFQVKRSIESSLTRLKAIKDSGTVDEGVSIRVFDKSNTFDTWDRILKRVAFMCDLTNEGIVHLDKEEVAAMALGQHIEY